MRLSRMLLVWLMLPAWCLAAEESLVIPLWPSEQRARRGSGTGSGGRAGEERAHDRHVSRVHNPTLTVYLPPRDKATGAAVVICPGGGHRFLAIDHEGYDVAKYLNSIGVAGIVLKYRLARTEGTVTRSKTMHWPMPGAAVRLVRSRHADDWGIDPKRVGLMGFSAGGETHRARGHAGRAEEPGRGPDRSPRRRAQLPHADLSRRPSRKPQRHQGDAAHVPARRRQRSPGRADHRHLLGPQEGRGLGRAAYLRPRRTWIRHA